MAALRRILGMAAPESRLIGASMGTQVITSSISLVFPAAIGRILDLSLSDSTGLSPTLVAGTLTGLFIFQGALIVGRTAMLNVAGERLIARFRKQLFASILAQDLHFFDRSRTGELINRLSTDTQLVQKSVTGNLVSGLRSSFMVVGGTMMLFYTSPTLALVSLSVIPPVGVAARYFGRYLKGRQAKVQDALAETSTVAEEVIANIRTVRQFASEPLEVAKYNARIDTAYRRACEVGLASAWFDGSVHLAANFSLVAVLTFGGSQVMSGQLTAGALTSFLMYSLYVGFNITNLSSVYSDLMRGVGASSRIFGIIDRVPQMPSSITSARASRAGATTDPSTLPPSVLHSIYSLLDADEDPSQKKHPIGADFFGIVQEERDRHITPPGTSVLARSGYDELADQISATLETPPIKGEIELRDVSFAYPLRSESPILQNLNLRLERGSMMALVGSSGSGKSTIGAMLMRMYDPQQGVVLIDGVDIRRIDPHWLRKHIGVVAQEPVLFSGTIEENIRYGNMDASMDQVYNAARAARALDFIEGFPNGFNTRVGERGVQLSGGQKQRVAIARAILKDPPIVILDEATSALDAESEFQVQQAIEEMMKGRSVVSIAHRLSTMRAADTIAVLEQGRIAEQGSFDELMQKGSALQNLVKRQL
ncbi:ABC transporter ATP-binding protein [Hondaea fermentalgiana]|uniref:ABC transporter ATP-binding protein n=1 Tax=Hondaea fermentalgiana TaxID=2315210 RepID=A0A2R5G1M6_9STRA|nr:ABC transporter ATP-binding protein [Hondaea fermentalgiana]|eukprot:GBG24926.1 ABC transporter ATP-binding protein [Hondaea fermentalgiana]